MAFVHLASGRKIHYRQKGEGENTLILINGSVFNSFQWEKTALPIFCRLLLPRFKIIMYDYPGFGKSPASSQGWNMRMLAAQLHEITDKLNLGRVHLFGMSKGGLVGQAYTIDYPEKVLSFGGLGTPFLGSKSIEITRLRFFERVAALESLPEILDDTIQRRHVGMIMKRVFAPAIFKNRNYNELQFQDRAKMWVIERLVAKMLIGSRFSAILSLFKYYVNGLEKEVPFFQQNARHIKSSNIYFFSGEKDQVATPAMMQEMASIIPHASIKSYPDVTHMGPMLLKKEGAQIFTDYCNILLKLTEAPEMGYPIPAKTQG